MQDAEKLQELTSALAEEQQARQQLAAELQTAQAALTAAEHARLEFVSLVTHELRVPMTSIKGYTDLLIKGVMGPVSETQLAFLRTIRANVERMSRMVADLSDINKLEGNDVKLNWAVVPLPEAVDEAARALKDEIAQKSQALIIKLPEDLPALHCDRGRLIQVLNTLLSNATKYTPERGGIIVTATADAAAQTVQIKVQDSGYGILADEQARVFEKFFRASDEETRQTPGNGLALHVAQRVLELHGGRIWFESTRGKGTSFYLELPMAAAAPANA